MNTLLIGFGTVFLYKLVSNTVNYFLMSYYMQKHAEYLFMGNNQFIMYQHSIKTLVERANITSTFLPVSHTVASGHVLSGNVNCLDNMTNPMEDIAFALKSIMLKAKGTYRSRILETFSPRYWIEFIIFFPKHLVLYLGLNADTAFTKTLQLFWWVITPAAVFFREQLLIWVTDFINQLH